jgi:hypothetical protein
MFCVGNLSRKHIVWEVGGDYMGTGSDAGRSLNGEHSAVASTMLGIIRGAQCCSQGSKVLGHGGKVLGYRGALC